jgi:hypothetical protein
LQLCQLVGCSFASWWVAALPVGGLQLCQLVGCSFASWWVAALPVGGFGLLAVGGLGTLGFSTKIFLVTLPRIFCMGKGLWGM